MNRKNKLLYLLLFVVTTMTSYKVYAESIQLTLQREKLSNIGIYQFVWEKSNADDVIEPYQKELFNTYIDDLRFQSLLNIIVNPNTKNYVKLSYWQAKKAHVIIYVKNTHIEANLFKSTLFLYDLRQDGIILQKSYQFNLKNVRKLAHKLSSDTLFKLTGQKGVSESNILFVNNLSNHKEIYISAYDGYAVKQLTFLNSLSIFPKWSIPNKGFFFTSYITGNPDMFYYSMLTKQITPISQRYGLNYAVDPSPNKKDLLITLLYRGTPHLYLINDKGRNKRRLTWGRSINTSGAFSRDGEKIAFISSRAGSPQLYIMNKNGTDVKRIHTGRGEYDSPTWSNNGQIAYSKKRGAQCNIFIYNTLDHTEIQIAPELNNAEDPSFSSDGSILIFSIYSKKRRILCLYSLQNGKTKKLTVIPGNSFSPQWSK